MNILHIDDNYGDYILTKEAFKRAGSTSTITNAIDGDRGLTFLEESLAPDGPDRPDLIMLDVNLPTQSGYEVLQTIKNSTEFKNIPVILFSSSCAKHDVEAAYNFSANCYITKPDSLDELVCTANSILNCWKSVLV